MPGFEFVLAGRYRLVAPLGEGGMAAVYRGRDLRLNREVAIKVLREDLTQDPTFLTRFQREAEYVASLSHPNIVPVYDVGEHQNAHFIVMEYIRGRTLRDAIEQEGQMVPARALAIMRRVLDALAYAHGRGIIHRDVKPHNILLAADGTPRLVDFGIAHLADASATRTAAILGSAHYLSPEQARGEEATERSDLYGCGIVLFEMLAGYPPFDGNNALAIAHEHIHAPVPSLTTINPGVIQDLERVVQRALAKRPEDRYADASAFADALPDVPANPMASTVRPLERPAGESTTVNQLPIRRVPPREQELIIRRSTRKVYLFALFALMAIAVGASFISRLAQTGVNMPHYPSPPYVLVPGGIVLVFLLYWLQTRSWVYTMTGNAAVAQWGMIGHRRFGLPLRRVARLELKQSPLERLLGVGTIELHGRDDSGEQHCLVMEDVPRPRDTYDELMHLLSTAARTDSHLVHISSSE